MITKTRAPGGNRLTLVLVTLVVVYVLASAAIAVSTLDDCRNRPSGGDKKHWRVLPPEWVCD